MLLKLYEELAFFSISNMLVQHIITLTTALIQICFCPNSKASFSVFCWCPIRHLEHPQLQSQESLWQNKGSWEGNTELSQRDRKCAENFEPYFEYQQSDNFRVLRISNKVICSFSNINVWVQWKRKEKEKKKDKVTNALLSVLGWLHLQI